MGILQISVVIGHEVSYISCFWSMMYLMLVLSVKLVKLSILVQARSVAFSQWCGKAVPDCFIECKIGI
uniref:Uncharacterized protein n=1 Tax=Solanum tuberosum TaxID=4113 RepID=M1CFG8_SOLTU